MCTDCNDIFYRGQSKPHPRSCLSCNKKCQTTSELITHLEERPTHALQLTCSICGTKCNGSDDLLKHLSGTISSCSMALFHSDELSSKKTVSRRQELKNARRDRSRKRREDAIASLECEGETETETEEHAMVM